MNEKFTWIPFYKELSDWLLEKQNSQPDLISVLKEIGITGFRDGTEKGKNIELNEIDPFTFLSYLNKFNTNERRVEILQDLRTELKFRCQEPKDVAGLPTIHPMKVHLFPWKTTRDKDDITALWDLFRQAKEGKIEEQLFQTVLNIKSVGKGKLSFASYEKLSEEANRQNSTSTIKSISSVKHKRRKSENSLKLSVSTNPHCSPK